MSFPKRAAVAAAILVIPIATAIGINRAEAQGTALHIVMVDNSAPSTPAGDPNRSYFAFAPEHFSVGKGQQITFDNPATSRWSHTVVSINWSGGIPYDTLTTGQAFTSSPTIDDEIHPGESWTLDTSNMDPGQYLFYCSIHPWMVGTFTVQPAA